MRRRQTYYLETKETSLSTFYFLRRLAQFRSLLKPLQAVLEEEAAEEEEEVVVVLEAEAVAVRELEVALEVAEAAVRE